MPRPHLGPSYNGDTAEPLPDCMGPNTKPIFFNNIAQKQVMPRPHLGPSYTTPLLAYWGYGETSTRL